MKLKNILILLSLVLSGISLHGQGEWITDFDAALAEARAQNKSVLVNFTGSDWCGWCIKLDKEVFSQDAFKQFAATELVSVEIDFPTKKEQSEVLKAQNEKLLEKYNVRGFPTIIVLSSDGELLGTTGYQAGGPAAYVAHLKEIIGE